VGIPNIQLGRVESDPMGIPMAASMRTGTDNSFDQFLRDSVATDESNSEQPSLAKESGESIESEIPDSDNDADSPRDLDQDEDQPQSDNGADDSQEQRNAEVDAEVTENTKPTEPDRQTKNTAAQKQAPSTTPQSSEPLIAATLQAQNAGQSTLATATQGQATTATAARAIEPTMRGSANASLANNASHKAASVQTGYSSKNAAQAQMLEQARDSVFKQILMKLTGDGGEVRMRLDPPDLGQLDLRMTVEGGNKLSLTLSAERQDINLLLQRHLDELKVTLQENGLEITGAEVQTRSEFDSQQEQRDRSEEGSASSDIAENADSTPQSRGYITAEGLDFWA
jgi:hypothetical protein